MSRRAQSALVATFFVAGVVLMVFFDAAVTRALGVACLFGFVAAGLFLIADRVLLSGGAGARES